MNIIQKIISYFIKKRNKKKQTELYKKKLEELRKPEQSV